MRGVLQRDGVFKVISQAAQQLHGESDAINNSGTGSKDGTVRSQQEAKRAMEAAHKVLLDEAEGSQKGAASCKIAFAALQASVLRDHPKHIYANRCAVAPTLVRCTCPALGLTKLVFSSSSNHSMLYAVK
jgi:hypothetical protein